MSDRGNLSANLAIKKIGSLLEKTRDALLADLEKELVCVRMAISDFEAKHQEQEQGDKKKWFENVSTASELITLQTNIINGIFARLGFEVANKDGLKEIGTLVSNMLAAVDTLVSACQKATESSANEGLGLMQTGGELFKAIKALLESVKAFKEDTIAQVLRDNTTQMEDAIKSFDLKAFASHVLDYVFIVLLQNARMVFADELAFIQLMANGIVNDAKDNLEEVGRNLQNQIDALGNDAKDMAQTLFGDVQREIENAYSHLSADVKNALKELKPDDNIYQSLSDGLSKTYAILSFLGIIAPKTIELHMPKSVIDVLDKTQKEMNAVAGEITRVALSADGKLKKAEEMGRAEIQKIKDATQKISKSLGSELAISTDLLNLSQFSLLNLARDVQAGIGQSSNHLAEITHLTYPIEVVEVRWHALDRFFTHPLNYLKQLYPIENVDDAQALATKVMDLAHQLNPDIPDFSSLRSMLETLIRNLAKKILTTTSETRKEMWQQIRPIITTIRKIVDMLRELADVMQKEMDAVADETIALLVTVFSVVGTELSKAYDYGAGIEKDIEKILVEAGNNAWKDATDEIRELRKAVVRYIHKVKVPRVEDNLFDEVLLDSVKDVLRKWNIPDPENVATSLANNANTEIKKWGSGVYHHLSEALDKKAWENRLKVAFAQLKVELRKDFQSVSIQGVNEGINTSNLAALLSPQTVKQLSGNIGKNLSMITSELSLADYVSIVTKVANEVFVPNPECYYMGFRQCISKIVNECKGQILSINTTDIERFAKELAEAVWQRIKQKLFMPYVREITATVSSTLRLIIRQRLQQVVSGFDDMVKKAMNEAKEVEKTANAVIDLVPQGLNAIEKFIDAPTLSTLRDLKEVSNKTLTFIGEQTGAKIDVIIPSTYLEWLENVIDSAIVFATSPMGYKDILTLVTSLYKGLPKEVLKSLEDVLPSIPDNVFTQYACNIDYQCDLENKFLLGTLVDLSAENVTNQENTVSLDSSLLMQLCMFMGEDDNTKQPAIFLYIMLKGDLKAVFSLGKNHTLSLQAQLAAGEGKIEKIDDETKKTLQDGFGFSITKDWKVRGIANWDKVCAMFVSKFDRNKDAPELELFDTKYISASIENYPQLLYIGYDKSCRTAIAETGLSLTPKTYDGNRFMFGYISAIKDAKVVLKLSEIDLLKAFAKENCTVVFDTYLWLDLQEGLNFGGDVRLKLKFDLNGQSLGPVIFNNLELVLGPKPHTTGTLVFDVKSMFQIKFADTVTMAIEGLGVGFDVNYRKADGSIGDWDLSPQLTLPTGIGLAIDAQIVKGGGFISMDKETGDFFGAVELTIAKRFSVSGYVLCDTGSKPGHNFNLVVLISTHFSPGIPLGMGFSLTGLGGCLGLNRQISRQGMVQSVRQGTLGSVFFVDNLMNHLAEMKASVMGLFPAKKGQFFFGLLAQISYEPIIKCDFGLLLQLPSPTEIIIVGALKVSLAGNEKLICINVYFAGGIKFEEGMWFDASIIDSQIVGLRLEGDMAFRLNWAGENKGFLLSVGGFHPAYKPEPGLMVSNMRRMAVKLDYKILRMSLEAYLAITSNTFQIGARLDVNVGWKKFGLYGYAGFDALFQFNPFRFLFSAVAGMSVRLGGRNILSVHLQLDVEGPAPWKVRGKASFRVIFKVTVNFNVTWGKKAEIINPKIIEVLPLLYDEYEKESNWVITNNDIIDDLVKLVEQKKGNESLQMLQPSGKLTFNQATVPMKTICEGNSQLTLDVLEKCNDARPIDCVSLEIVSVVLGANGSQSEFTFTRGNGLIDEKNDFAPSLYRELTVDEKLKAPSYIKCNSGFTIEGANRAETEFKTDYKLEHNTKYERWTLI